MLYPTRNHLFIHLKKGLFNFKAKTFPRMKCAHESNRKKVYKEAHRNNDGSNRALMGMHVLH